MIDQTDRQTLSLPLDEQPAKPRRGRPATGQALSNAERQRLYRERQKAQRNENVHKAVAEDLRAELATALERVEQLERANRNLEKDLEMKNGQIKALSRRAQSAETELSLRGGNKMYYVERCSKGKRTWRRIGDGRSMTREIADAVMSDLSAAPINKGDRFRIVPA